LGFANGFRVSCVYRLLATRIWVWVAVVVKGTRGPGAGDAIAARRGPGNGRLGKSRGVFLRLDAIARRGWPNHAPKSSLAKNFFRLVREVLLCGPFLIGQQEGFPPRREVYTVVKEGRGTETRRAVALDSLDSVGEKNLPAGENTRGSPFGDPSSWEGAPIWSNGGDPAPGLLSSVGPLGRLGASAFSRTPPALRPAC